MRRTKAATMDEKAQVINLRALGLSSSAIAEQTNLSVRTVQRINKSMGVAKGELGDEILAEGRERLRMHALGDERVKDAMALHLLDEMAQVKALREKSAAILEGFNPKNDIERANYMRSAVAYSTMLKNTSDIACKAYNLDKHREDSMTEELPHLVFREMTEEEVVIMRRQQEREARELGYLSGDDEAATREDVS